MGDHFLAFNPNVMMDGHVLDELLPDDDDFCKALPLMHPDNLVPIRDRAFSWDITLEPGLHQDLTSFEQSLYPYEVPNVKTNGNNKFSRAKNQKEKAKTSSSELVHPELTANESNLTINLSMNVNSSSNSNNQHSNASLQQQQQQSQQQQPQSYSNYAPYRKNSLDLLLEGDDLLMENLLASNYHEPYSEVEDFLLELNKPKDVYNNMPMNMNNIRGKNDQDVSKNSVSIPIQASSQPGMPPQHVGSVSNVPNPDFNFAVPTAPSMKQVANINNAPSNVNFNPVYNNYPEALNTMPGNGAMPQHAMPMNATSAPMPTTTLNGINSSEKRVGIYTIEERKNKIEKFRERKRQRIWRKQIKYDCRKRLADTRPRVKGRFVSRKNQDPDGLLSPDGNEDDDNNSIESSTPRESSSNLNEAFSESSTTITSTNAPMMMSMDNNVPIIVKLEHNMIKTEPNNNSIDTFGTLLSPETTIAPQASGMYQNYPPSQQYPMNPPEPITSTAMDTETNH